MTKELENILIAKQIKPTSMRLLVLESILKQKTAISVHDLEKVLQHSDRVTLYRTLKTFEEKGLIHTIKGGAEETKYALCEAACREGAHYDMHIHFFCTNCGELLCLPEGQMPPIQLPAGFEMQEVSLVVRGICSNCKKQCNTVA